MHFRLITLAALMTALTGNAQVFKDVPPEVLRTRTLETPTNNISAIPEPANSGGLTPQTSAPMVAAGTTNIPAGYLADEKYQLRVGDKLSFQILEDREPQPKPVVVMDSGEVDVPYLGRLPAVGKTCRQLSDEIKTLLEKEYYYRATVVLAVDVANRVLGRVYVWGAVRNQGAIEMAATEKLTAGKAILRAGGFADFANKKKVKLVRAASEGNGEKPTFLLNMVEILDEGQTEKDVVLQPEDFLIVPTRLINF